MKDLEIYKDTDDLIHALAEALSIASKDAIAARGQFNFVLSGGGSPRKLYDLLASKAYKDKIEWDKTYFFFGDERFVPENDTERNSLMAKETLFEPLKIAASHIFQVDTTGSPEEAAQNYAKTIATHFQNEPIIFDFILLGLGNDAHTGSLFPYTTVLEETEATIKSVFIKDANTYRITMTAPLINQARHIAFLVFGKDKAKAVFEVLEGTSGTYKQFPARLINLDTTKVEWFLDTASASHL